MWNRDDESDTTEQLTHMQKHLSNLSKVLQLISDRVQIFLIYF